MPFSGLGGYEAHKCCTNIHAGNKPIYIRQIISVEDKGEAEGAKKKIYNLYVL